jgi:hypothetical protein
MPKNKNYKNKNTNISPFVPKLHKNEDSFKLFNSLIADCDLSDIEDDEFYPNEMMTILPVMLSSTNDMTKLIIENRARNGEKMTDQDIYQIHSEAFKYITNIFNEK